MVLFDNSAMWFWQASGTIAIVISFIAVRIQLRLQRFTHIIDSTEKLVAIWNSNSNLRLRKQVCNKLKNDNSYFGNDSEELLDIFERIGLYVKIKALPSDVAWEAFSWFIDHYYVLSKNGIDEMRADYNDELLFNNFTWLAGKMNRVSCTKYTKPNLNINPSDLLTFLDSEIAIADVRLNINDNGT